MDVLRESEQSRVVSVTSADSSAPITFQVHRRIHGQAFETMVELTVGEQLSLGKSEWHVSVEDLELMLKHAKQKLVV